MRRGVKGGPINRERTMKKAQLSIVVLLAFAGSPALAGEITGTGASTPIRSHVASSICAFSGLNDDGSGPSTLVQSYGQIVAAFGKPQVGPGTECRGN